MRLVLQVLIHGNFGTHLKLTGQWKTTPARSAILKLIEGAHCRDMSRLSWAETGCPAEQHRQPTPPGGNSKVQPTGQVFRGG